MTIWVNQQSKEVDRSINIEQLMQLLQKSEKKGIAVALNNKVIGRSNWSATMLQEQDKITIITATQGG